MIQQIKHLAVNWVDGMKISQKHFIHQENFIIDSIRDASSVGCSKFNYGILPLAPSLSGKSMFDIFNTTSNDVQLTIKQCNAITPAGYRIDITNMQINVKSLVSDAEKDGSLKDDQYYILINVNPFEKVPFGDVDPDEVPPRHPNTIAKYHVDILPSNSFNKDHSGGNYLIVGRVNVVNNVARADNHFIPPCTSMHSHQILIEAYNKFASNLANMQHYAAQIIQKNNFKDQNTVLTNNIKSLCNVVMDHYALSYFQYRNIIPQLPPIYFIDVFAKQALLLYNIIKTLPTLEMEEMLNYSYEWSEIPPHQLLSQLSTVIELNYNHNQCGEYLESINNLLLSLENMLEKLSRLEFIGQRKENIIVNEKEVHAAVRDKKGWSILD